MRFRSPVSTHRLFERSDKLHSGVSHKVKTSGKTPPRSSLGRSARSSLNLASDAEPQPQGRRRDWLVGTVSNPPGAVPHVTSLRASSRTSEHIARRKIGRAHV